MTARSRSEFPTASPVWRSCRSTTRGMPLSKDVNQEKLADVTHGFVGADLAALARESGMRAIRRVLPEIDLEVESIPAETLNKIEVNNDDFPGCLAGDGALRHA